MKSNKITAEYLFYGLAFLLALGLRLFQLGSAPLSDFEAGWALQALGLAHHANGALGAQPAYLVLTGTFFSIFRDTNFLARFFPALAGSLLVWIPWFFRDWMKDSPWLHRAGLIMAFGLAIDPGLVSLSRQAGSLMPAMSFALLTLACLHKRYLVWTGIFAGLALLSGQAFLQGLLVFGISWSIYRLVTRSSIQSPSDEGINQASSEPISTRSMGVILAAFAGTLLVAGTLFLRFPQGLGALAETLPAFINTWIKPSGIPVLRLPASLLVYQPLLLIFGIMSLIHAWHGELDRPEVRKLVLGLGIWTVVALLLPLLYSGRQVGDMAWALVPLWALTAIEISRLLVTGPESALTRLITFGLALLLFVLVVVSWVNLLSIGRYQSNVVVYWAIIVGAFLLGVIAILLVAAAGSTTAARLGLVWALCVVLGLWLFSNTWRMTIVRQNGAQDLWPRPPTTGQADLLAQTLSDLSSWNSGMKDELEIISLVDSPALQWELRSFSNARFATSIPVDAPPPVVLTLKDAELPGLEEKYRGQDFVWRLYPDWLGIFPPNLINWLAFRQAPLRQDQIILWAREDIFPGGAADISESVVP